MMHKFTITLLAFVFLATAALDANFGDALQQQAQQSKEKMKAQAQAGLKDAQKNLASALPGDVAPMLVTLATDIPGKSKQLEAVKTALSSGHFGKASTNLERLVVGPGLSLEQKIEVLKAADKLRGLSGAAGNLEALKSGALANMPGIGKLKSQLKALSKGLPQGLQIKLNEAVDALAAGNVDAAKALLQEISLSDALPKDKKGDLDKIVKLVELYNKDPEAVKDAAKDAVKNELQQAVDGLF